MLDTILAKAVSKIILEGKRVVFMPYSESRPEQIIQSYSLQSYLVMLHDQLRLNAYKKVIDKTVKGKIVLEIGTGAHAPLAIACARAGAKKVYAIEANPKAFQSARRLIKKKRVDDVIELFLGLSPQITLPAKAEVLVQDMIGNIGSSEGMVSFMVDAKKRLLQENAIFIPEVVRSFVVPVQKPKEATPWLMKFSNILYWWMNPPKKMAIMNFPRSNFLGSRELFEDFVLNKPIELFPHKAFTFIISQAGRFDGFLFWIQVKFDEETVLDCLSGTSWCSVFVPISESIVCDPGDHISLETASDLSGAPKYSLNTKVLQNGTTRQLKAINC